MMNIKDLLHKLNENAIDIWVENGKLRYKAPIGAFNDELKALVTENKEKLLQALDNSTNSRQVFPLSLNQQSLWFLNYMYPESPAYNVAVSFSIESTVDLVSMQGAFDFLLKKYDMLRSVFRINQEKNEPVQEIKAFESQKIEIINAAQWSDIKLKENIEAEYVKPFDLSRGPLIKLLVFKLKNNKYNLLFVLHHILCDAYSLNLMMNSFFKYYHLLITGGETKQETEGTQNQYRVYLDNQNHFLNNSEELNNALDFWKSRLENFPGSINLPYDNSYPDVLKLKGSTIHFSFSDDDFKKLIEFSRHHKSSLNATIMAVFEILLFSLTQQSELLYGVLSSGRYKRIFKDTFGYLINPLVKAVSLIKDITFLEYLHRSRKDTLEIFNHQELPFTFLVDKLSTGRNQGKSPLFQVLYNYINYQSFDLLTQLLTPSLNNQPIMVYDVPVLPYTIKQQEGQFEMTFEVFERPDQLFCALKYHSDLFEGKSALKFVELYQKILKEIIENPEISLENLIKNNSIALNKQNLTSEKQIVIAANFTIDPILPYIEYLQAELKMGLKVQSAPYNQVFQQLLDKQSLFYHEKTEIVVLFLALDQWVSELVNPPDEQQKKHLLENLDKFISAVKNFRGQCNKTLCIFNTSNKPAIKSKQDSYLLFQDLESKMVNGLADTSGVYVFQSPEIDSLYPVENYYEELTAEIADIPYHEDYYLALAIISMRKFYASRMNPYKLIVVDCDNTLWDGVVAEQGWKHIEISDEKSEFQKLLLKMVEAGMLLCLASKNNSEDVLDVFRNRQDMLIKDENISVKKINWNPKSESIKEIAKELNLGLDSFIFIDDNPIECAEVRSNCPGVFTVQMPETGVRQFFNHLWVFDILRTSSADKIRQHFYKSEVQRKELEKSSYSFKQFIDELNLNIEIQEITSKDIQRVSQLSMRVNQFNFTAEIFDESQINQMISNSDFFVFTVRVKDKFADYGMVGVFVLFLLDNVLYLKNFLLSCRALGKGIEHHMISWIGKWMLKNSFDQLEINYKPTQRNLPVKKFLDSIIPKEDMRANAELYTCRLSALFLEKINFNPDSQKPAELSNKAKAETIIKSKNDLELLLRIQNDFSTVKKLKSAYQKWQASNALQYSKNTNNSKTDKISEIESSMKKIWADILNHENFSVDDNFFEIGGKSVLIPILILKIKEIKNIELSIVDIFRFPTVRTLCSYLNNNMTKIPKNSKASNTHNKMASFKNKIKSARKRIEME